MRLNFWIKFFVFQATLGVALTSCTVKVPYTSTVQTKYKLTDRDIQKIQFYLSDQIVLYRASNDGQASANNGELVVSSDRQKHEVILRKGTPGVVTQVMGDRLAVSFEYGDGKALVFGNNHFDSPYYLMAEEWERKHGKMEYGGDVYFAVPGSSAAHLVLRLKKLRQLEKKTRIATGRRL
jgi:hypothetical protein